MKVSLKINPDYSDLPSGCPRDIFNAIDATKAHIYPGYSLYPDPNKKYKGKTWYVYRKGKDIHTDEESYKVVFRQAHFECSCKEWQENSYLCIHIWLVLLNYEVPDKFSGYLLARPELLDYIELSK
jgi:hypothetical protein